MADLATSRIDQCLFGYSDGHRLLASSIKLTADIASELTAASDLAPGARFARGGTGYWTGFPIPTLSCYGLMHTWSAPEMPRPGCVWTHLLLLDPRLLEEVADLSCFERLFKRPSSSGDHGFYTRSVDAASLPHELFMSKPSSAAADNYDRDRTIELLEVLYNGGSRPIEVSQPGELDDLVFELWSQQWPRLRRNFRFQTAASSGSEGTSRQFDLQLRTIRSSEGRSKRSSSKIDAWLDAAANDIEPGSQRTFRAFLWRYGQDVKRQRGSFRPLAQLFVASTKPELRMREDVAKSVSNAFPEAKDALRLKRDLVDGTIFPDAQVDVLLHLCNVDQGRSLPVPSDSGLSRLAANWPVRSSEMMHIAEWAAIHPSDFADRLLATVAKVVPESDFWEVTEDFPEMRRRLAANHPEVLDSERIASLDADVLLNLLEVVPEGHDVGSALVRRLANPTSRQLVEAAVAKFPAPILRQAIDTANDRGADAAEPWLSVLAAEPARILDPKVFARIERTSILAALAGTMGWLSDEVLDRGLAPWAAAIQNARDDLDEYSRDQLEALLFTMAAIEGGEHATQIFERSFGYLHRRMTESYISWQAYGLLRPILPDVSIFKDWDNALKLRLAVVHAYVQHGLNPASFARLLRDKKQIKMLRKAADDVPGGHQLSLAAHI